MLERVYEPFSLREEIDYLTSISWVTGGVSEPKFLILTLFFSAGARKHHRRRHV